MLGVALLAATCGRVPAAPSPQEGQTMGSVSIRWWGQACFSLTDEQGLCVLVDPFPKDFGYPSPTVEPQVCLVTHEHRDHNAVDNVQGQPTVVRGVGEHEAAGLKLRGLAAAHDDQDGAQRGQNTIFAWEMAGLRLAHVGDLGRVLSDEQIKALGPVEVLMVPVGGYYTIDAAQAIQVARQVGAKVVLPMHYRTAAVPKSPIAPLEDFLATLPGDWQVEKPAALTVSLSKADLPEAGVKVIVLKYE
jgi:L-ascorbate metabolism protein UlaG (beta-lactamase superfamily)